jgi:hypothetical protein
MFKFENGSTASCEKFYQMNLSSFKESLSWNEPPQNSSVYLNALWYDAKGEWHKAHELIQDVGDKKASWIHAYLHRKEGDPGNADYWYSRAGKIRSSVSLEKEWEEIVAALI